MAGRADRHGQARTPTWLSWRKMRDRCLNPNATGYKNYGGRGIKICKRWNDFANFLADMGARPDGKSLDRINGNGNYEPSNCRWATAAEQSDNRRVARGENVYGAKLTAADVREIRELAKTTLQSVIAGRFGVAPCTISGIVARKEWGHVE